MCSPLEPPETNAGLLTLIIAFESHIKHLTYRAGRYYMCVVLSHEVCGNLLHHQEKISISMLRHDIWLLTL